MSESKNPATNPIHLHNPRPARRFNLLMLILQGLLSFSGFVFAGALLGVMLRGWLPGYMAVVLAVVFGFFAVVIHEGGHWLGATLGGMRVLFVRAFAVELQLLRQGMRFRPMRRRKGQGFDGYVLAVDPPDRPWRRARLWFIAMGPLMNLLTAVLCLPLALLTVTTFPPFAACILAFAAINLAMGLANLVPTIRQMQSDGAQLLAWWRRPDEQGPNFAYARLLALSTSGVAAADLPVADLQQLDRQPMPAPLISLSFRLDALQAAGDWEAAVALGAELERLVNAHPNVRQLAPSVVATVRAEVAFCRAIWQRNASDLNAALLLNRDLDWYAPTLSHNYRALRAALKGQRDGVEHALGQAERIAENSRIQSTFALQKALAGHIRAVL
ncbi:Zn-dependent protease [Pseudomonas sp. TE3786]